MAFCITLLNSLTDFVNSKLELCFCFQSVDSLSPKKRPKRPPKNLLFKAVSDGDIESLNRLLEEARESAATYTQKQAQGNYCHMISYVYSFLYTLCVEL